MVTTGRARNGAILPPNERPCEDPRWHGSEVVFACPWFAVQRAGRWHRVTGAGGAVVLAVAARGLVMVEVYRPNTGRWHLELPRGKREESDESDVACALRELHEETGLTGDAASARRLGVVHPDTGLLGPLGVTAIAVDVPEGRRGLTDGEVAAVR